MVYIYSIILYVECWMMMMLEYGAVLCEFYNNIMIILL